MHDYDDAIVDYDEAMRLDSKLKLVHLNRGLAWFHKAEYDKAIADFTEEVRLNPSPGLTSIEAVPGQRRRITARPRPTLTRVSDSIRSRAVGLRKPRAAFIRLHGL